MSRSVAAVKKPKRVAVMPACKHCENLKLPSAHWLRSLKGEIVCPVLLSTECRYCHLTGHTVKACPELSMKKIKPTTVVKSVVVEEREPVVTLASPPVESSWNGKRTFANVLLKPTPAPSVLSLVHPDFIEFPKSPEHSPPIMPYRSYLEKYKGMRWEDISDSDSE